MSHDTKAGSLRHDAQDEESFYCLGGHVQDEERASGQRDPRDHAREALGMERGNSELNPSTREVSGHPDVERTSSTGAEPWLGRAFDAQRAFERFEIYENEIRTTLWERSDSPPAHGQLTNVSISGMWIDTFSPFPLETFVQVEWVLMTGLSMTFPGRVVRKADHGMAIHLRTDDSSWRFRSCFVDLARTPALSPPSVVVRKVSDTPEAQPRSMDEAALSALASQWRAVESDPQSERLHQDFMHACMRLRKLEFALERYRDLRLLYPESPIAARYLQQIGTVLSFYTIPQGTSQTAEAQRWVRVWPLAVVFAVAATILLGLSLSE